MEFALSRIYVKFYICQILNSISYYEMKKQQLEFQELIEYSYMEDSNPVDEQATNGMIISEDYKTESIEKISNNFINSPNVSFKYDVTMRNSNSNFQIPSPIKNFEMKESLQNFESPIYRKYFVYKNVVYSKVEIQGLVVEIQNLGYEEKNNLRYVIYIDDTTGVIQAISWKNNSNKVYEKIEKSLKCGKFIRILGQIDFFLNSFEVIIENIQLIKSFSTELLFHSNLQKNQSSINESNISSLLNLEENKYEDKNERDTRKKYSYLKKDFANRLLAFFQKYRLNNETMNEGFIQVKIRDLFNIRHFNLLMEEFCKENRIEDREKFFKDTFSLLEEHALGRILNSDYMEIKVDDMKIKSEILNLLKSSESGISYIEIFDSISKIFDNFFMTDYLKFVIGQLLEKGEIMQITPNTYQIINN